jgi:hypothetical protein
MAIFISFFIFKKIHDIIIMTSFYKKNITTLNIERRIIFTCVRKKTLIFTFCHYVSFLPPLNITRVFFPAPAVSKASRRSFAPLSPSLLITIVLSVLTQRYIFFFCHFQLIKSKAPNFSFKTLMSFPSKFKI